MTRDQIRRIAAERRAYRARMNESNTASQKAAYVSFDGPFPDQDEQGDEIPSWGVGIFTEEDIEIKVYTTHSYEGGRNLAEKIARDRKIELVDEAMRA